MSDDESTADEIGARFASIYSADRQARDRRSLWRDSISRVFDQLTETIGHVNEAADASGNDVISVTKDDGPGGLPAITIRLPSGPIGIHEKAGRGEAVVAQFGAMLALEPQYDGFIALLYFRPLLEVGNERRKRTFEKLDRNVDPDELDSNETLLRILSKFIQRAADDHWSTPPR